MHPCCEKAGSCSSLLRVESAVTAGEQDREFKARVESIRYILYVYVGSSKVTQLKLL